MTLINELATGTVVYEGVTYLAEPVAGGAAYELFSEHPAAHFLRIAAPHRFPYHRFVPAAEVAVRGSVPTGGITPEAPLSAPLSRNLSWDRIHRISQAPPRDQHSAELLAALRGTGQIRRGTRMIKPLTPAAVAETLSGQLPHGFCYREWDVAHLRTPADLAVLTGDTSADNGAEAAFALRWRAIDPADYQAPVGDIAAGLVAMPPHDRVGPAVLGTGFAPSSSELIPEWVTTDLADLPMTAHAALVAYTADGTEVVLYTYQPEQRGWLRLVGPQWRHLLAAVPKISADQEYLPIPRDAKPATRLIGTFRGEEYDAVADPPDEFRILAMTRAARYPVEALLRRLRYVRWRGALGTVLSSDTSWVRMRLCRPDSANVAALGAQCYERGVYEAWAPTAEVTDAQAIDIPYAL